MRILLLSLMVFFAGLMTAQAQSEMDRVTHEVNTTIGIRNGGSSNTIYYECYSAMRKIESFLVDLGATNIDINCYGGYNPNGFSTLARIKGSFESTVFVSGGRYPGYFEPVKMKGHSNCALIAELFEIFEDNFVIVNLSGRGSRPSSSCRTSSSYNVVAQVLK